MRVHTVDRASQFESPVFSASCVVDVSTIDPLHAPVHFERMGIKVMAPLQHGCFEPIHKAALYVLGYSNLLYTLLISSVDISTVARILREMAAYDNFLDAVATEESLPHFPRIGKPFSDTLSYVRIGDLEGGR